MQTMRRKVFMSDLIVRLLQRAHLAEFRICGEAAEALEAALRERDEADRRYHDVCAAWLREQQTKQTTRSKPWSGVAGLSAALMRLSMGMGVPRHRRA